ncbi:MAG: ATP-binding protein [Piscirickettsiaceae bacterium]|nr:ATP-binding protein [Piscirickettsiaceae bacterium]
MNNQGDMQKCTKHNTQYLRIKHIWKEKSFISGCIKCHLEIIEIQRKDNFYMKREFQKRNDEARIATSFRRSGIPPRYTTRTIDNFKAITKQQRNTLSTVKNYINNFDYVMEKGTGMIMTGGVGTGKTHLASAIANYFIKREKTVSFMTISAMFRKIRETYRINSKKTEQEVIDDLREVDLLILDEIGLQKGSESEEYLLFEVLNERYGYFKPTIIISNLGIVDIKRYIGIRVMDRLKEGGGKLAVLDWKSYRKQVLKDERLPTLSKSKYTNKNL